MVGRERHSSIKEAGSRYFSTDVDQEYESRERLKG